MQCLLSSCSKLSTANEETDMTNIDKIIVNGHPIRSSLIDKFDPAVVGVTGDESPKLVYSYNIIVRILTESGWLVGDIDAYVESLKLLRSDDILIIYTVVHLPEG